MARIESDASNLPPSHTHARTSAPPPQCNYGGRVTDGQDRGTLLSLLGNVFGPDLFDFGHALSPSKEWLMPPAETKEYKQYMDYIDGLPVLAAPEVFGLHENAAITRDQAEANKLFDSLLLTLSNSGGGGAWAARGE